MAAHLPHADAGRGWHAGAGGGGGRAGGAGAGGGAAVRVRLPAPRLAAGGGARGHARATRWARCCCGALGAPVAAVFAVLHGLGDGIMTIAKGTLPLAFFGASGYGARQGWIALPGACAAGPVALAVRPGAGALGRGRAVAVGRAGPGGLRGAALPATASAAAGAPDNALMRRPRWHGEAAAMQRFTISLDEHLAEDFDRLHRRTRLRQPLRSRARPAARRTRTLAPEHAAGPCMRGLPVVCLQPPRARARRAADDHAPRPSRPHAGHHARPPGPRALPRDRAAARPGGAGASAWPTRCAPSVACTTASST